MSDVSHDELLNELLSMPGTPEHQRNDLNKQVVEAPASASPSRQQNMDLCQWQVCPNHIFRPAAKTVASLGAGAYSTGGDEFGVYLRRQPLLSDSIIELPESANITVLGGIQKFWKARRRYGEHGLVFKRGVLLWGPPGSGKTVTVHLLARDLIKKEGIVLFCGNPVIMLSLLMAVRNIEPRRPLIVVLEDIDEIIGNHGEHQILSMLDGEDQTDNVVYVATSNYPERLGARIVNRPSRFDERIYVGMPSLAARTMYLQRAGANGNLLDESTAARWAAETEGLSIAHLRELVAAVLCLEQDFDSVIKRLRSMNERPKDVDGFARRKLGYETAAQQGAGRGALNAGGPR